MSTARIGADEATAVHDAALALAVSGRYEEAQMGLQRALASVEHPPAQWFRNLGVLCVVRERWEEAAAAFRASLQEDDEYALAWRGLARSLFELKSFPAAAEALRRSLVLEPECPVAHELLARIALFLTLRDARLAHAREFRRLCPDSAAAQAAFAAAAFQVGLLEDSLEAFMAALAQQPDWQHLRSIWLTALLHDARQTGTSLRAAHETWSDTPAGLFAPAHLARARQGSNRLRIGYLTGEFGNTPAFYFLLPLFRHADRERFELFAYHSRRGYDAFTQEYQDLADHWADVGELDDAALVSRIREDAIDILVDLSGHYHGHRLGVFARRAAPMQATFPNYPCTTGLREIDYIFTDRWVCPEDAVQQYTEKPLFLPGGYLTYTPPRFADAPGPLPAGTNGYVTFGLFQRDAKIGRGVWDAVAAILRQVEGSRLLMHNAALELDNTGSDTQQRAWAELGARSVAADRIRFRGRLPLHEHLRVVAAVDIALDTFPYNGQTTTCECLWMGVPVVSLRGQSHASRVGFYLLDRLGLADWVADSPASYVERAVRAARDIDALSQLRSELRHCMATSPFLDGSRLAREVEQGYLKMWRECCTRASEEN